MTENQGVLPADEKDLPDLVALVNSAYRGESSKQGWTTEADLLGGIRTNENSLLELIKKPGSVILKYVDDNNNLIGCVNLQKQEDKLYLGLLTVSPLLQGRGTGAKLLSASEAYAIKNGLSAIIMTVISVRHELIAWYERHGYFRTGLTKPFPAGDPTFGIPREPLEFFVLEKKTGKNV